jgi:hypothetical protein
MTNSPNDPDAGESQAAKDKFMKDLQKITTPRQTKSKPANPAEPPSTDPRDSERRKTFKDIHGIKKDDSF